MTKQLQAVGAFPYSPDHNIHDILPDINLAPLVEIQDVIGKVGLYSEAQSRHYAEKIIKCRAEQKSIDSRDLSGIFNIDSLKILLIPLPILSALQQAFFPFEPEIVMPASWKDSSGSQVGNAVKLKKAGFFSDRGHAHDAEAFVSKAARESDAVVGTEVGSQTTLPVTVGGSGKAPK